MLKLLIVRHGNTFDKGDIVRRIGLRTDLPLSQSGIKQCASLAKELSNKYQTIDLIFCSELIRTQQTAKIISNHYQTSKHSIKRLKQLNEIDYGIDDGKPEAEVIKRLGQTVINNWDENAIVPAGWLFNASLCIQDLEKLTRTFEQEYTNKTILLITSNGVARFFPKILKDQTSFHQKHQLKMPTASVSEFNYEVNQGWSCKSWGLKASQLL